MNINKNVSYLLTKKNIYLELGYKSMTPVYNKYITTDKIAKELGFSTLQDFKKVRKFTLDQSKKIRFFLDDVVHKTSS